MEPRIFAVYKPKGPTSHDVINEIRRLTGERKVGHAGTLDPLASGVLVIGVGREATRKLHEIVAKEKEYIAMIRLGMESATDDEEGEKTEIPVANVPDRKTINGILKKFTGKLLQTPPIFSAVKIKGKPAYARARKGQTIEMSAREVFIKKITVLKYQWPHLELRVITGPGVYIRALAQDIGKALGTGGYLLDLERIRVGTFTKADTLTMEQLKQ